MLFTGDNGAGGVTSGLTVNNIAAHNEFVDNGDGLELTRGSNQNLVADNFFIMTRALSHRHKESRRSIATTTAS